MFPYTQFNPLSQVDNLNAPTNPAKSRLIAWTLKQPYPHVWFVETCLWLGCGLGNNQRAEIC